MSMLRLLRVRWLALCPPILFVAASAALAVDVTVQGTVSDSTATVSVNGRSASILPNGTYTAIVPVIEGPNTLTATATNRAQETTTAAVQITLDTVPPVRSNGRVNGQPSGSTLLATTTQATLSLDTNEAATCRWSSMPDTRYQDMPANHTLTKSNQDRHHEIIIAPVTPGSTFTGYIRCRDVIPNRNQGDFLISFNVAAADLPPVRSNGQVNGQASGAVLPAGTTRTTISLTTNEAATCQYTATPDRPYGSFTTPMDTTGGTAHSTVITGLANGQSYTYYIRCKDTNNNVNTDDFPIRFLVAGGGSPTNLLVNPGFQDGTASPTGWTTNSWNMSQPGGTQCTFPWATAQGGTDRLAKIICPTGGADDARWQQVVTVKPNTNYVLSGWIWVSNVVPQHYTHFEDVGANLSVAEILDPLPVPTTGTASSWSHRVLRFNSGNRTSITVYARLGYYSSLTTGTAYFDQLKLVEAATAPGTLSVTTFTPSPSSGIQPNQLIGFDAAVSGTSSGYLTMVVDCNTANGYTLDALWITSASSELIPDACRYATSGTYTAKVYAQRDGVKADRTTTVTVGSGGGGTNQAPVVTINGASSRTVTVNQSFSLVATVTDDGKPNPPGRLLYTWSSDEIFSPSAVSFASPNSNDTNVTITNTGTFVLTLSAFDGELAGYDSVTVTVNPSGGANLAPTVNVGPDATVTLPNTLALSPTVTDDGKPNPPSTLTYNWTKESGPDTVTFAPSATTKNVTANFTAAGTYVLKLTVSDSALSANDSLIVTVQRSGVSIPPCTFNGATLVQVEERFRVNWNCPAPATLVLSSGWGAPGSDPTPSGGTAPIALDVRPFVGEGDFTAGPGGPGLSSGWGAFMRLSEPGIAEVTLTPRDASGNEGPARTHQVTAQAATPTLTVDLTTEDGVTSGTGSLSKQLKVNLTGDARGLTTVNFDCDQSDGTYQETHPTIEDDLGGVAPASSYTSRTTCAYTNAGATAKTFTATVEVKRQGLTATDTLTITINPSTANRPDLAVASPITPVFRTPNAAMHTVSAGFTVTVKNQGAGAAAASTAKVYQMIDGVPNTAVGLGVGIDALTAGASDTATTEAAFIFDPGVSAGVQVKADAEGAITEANELNNTRSLTFTVPPLLEIWKSGRWTVSPPAVRFPKSSTTQITLNVRWPTAGEVIQWEWTNSSGEWFGPMPLTNPSTGRSYETGAGEVSVPFSLSGAGWNVSCNYRVKVTVEGVISNEINYCLD